MVIKTNHLVFILTIIVGYLVLSLDFVKAQTMTDQAMTDVSVDLVSNLIGHIEWVSTPGNQFTTGGIRYINNQNIVVNIGASTLPSVSSVYSVTGNILPVGTGVETGTYAFNQPSILQSGDGFKTLSADYETLWGIYHTGEVRIFLDQTGPTKPEINFTNGIIISGSLNINWSGGYIDTGVGFHEYILHIALDPGFTSEILIPISGTDRIYSTNSLPLGTIWWYLESVDYLGNSTPSNVFYFHNQLPSYAPQGGAYIPIPLQENYTSIPHNAPDLEYIVVTVYKPNRKIYTGSDDLKSMLLYRFINSSASANRLLPLISPKTGVDIEEFTKDANDYIRRITNTPIQSPLRYQITLGLLLLFICLYWIKEHFTKKDCCNIVH